MSVALIREMFQAMVVGKNADLVDRYYSEDFRLHSNGVTQGFQAFADEHRKVYGTAIEYSLEYDDDAWVDAGDRVAGRVWITTSRPDEEPTRIEVIFIAVFRDARIQQLWETTWPNWAELGAFDQYDTTE